MVDANLQEDVVHGFTSRMLLVCFLYGFLPVIALSILGDWFHLTKENKKLSKVVGKLLIAILLFISLINGCYFSIYTFGTVRGKLHMIAALFLLLFVAFLLCTHIKDVNVKIGVIVSYVGVSISFASAATEYYFEKLEEMTYLFVTGMVVYVFGYILICARLTAIWVCSKSIRKRQKAR